MALSIRLQKFEGPLALLLYLIRKEEMDIFDINIHEITRQYLDFIKIMKELDLEMAGEFIAMAASLIQIKSKMLLPQYNEHGEIVETEDPRKELVQKLLEYQKFQEAAKSLYDRPLIGRDTWPRGVRETLIPKEDEIILEDNALFTLIATYRKMLKSFNKKIHKVSAKAQSISSRIMEIKDRLIPGYKLSLMDLITSTESRARQVLITFLSILELGKMGLVSIYQTENYSDIWIEAKKTIELDMLSRVEEYDSVDAEQVAQKMMDDSKKLITLEDETLMNEEVEQELSQGTEIVTMNLGDEEGLLNPLESLAEDVATDDEILAAENELNSDEVLG